MEMAIPQDREEDMNAAPPEFFAEHNNDHRYMLAALQDKKETLSELLNAV